MSVAAADRVGAEVQGRPALKHRWLYAGLAGLCLLVGVLLPTSNPVYLLAALLLGLVLLIMMAWPEAGTLAGFFILYTNLPVVAIRFHGAPRFVALTFVLLFGIPLFYQIFFQKRGLIIDRTLQLMLIFLLSLLTSSLFAKQFAPSLEWMVVFVSEGIILYFLVINVVRGWPTLRRVLTVLLVACALLGALSLYQELTKSYSNQLGGLAQRSLKFVRSGEDFRSPRERIRVFERSEGPLGKANRYAQIMIVMLPLGFFRFWESRSWPARLTWAGVVVLILSGILLTYSRGAFLALGLLALLLVCLRYLRPGQIARYGLILVLLIPLLAPGYVSRMSSLWAARDLLSEKSASQADGAIRGRATEMLAATLVFLDYPLFGVGPGQYTPFYSSDYHSDPDIAFRQIPETRRAHSLYLELAAETGLVGMSIFMTIAILVLRQLWRLRQHFLASKPQLSNLATGLLLGLVGYLTTGLFLHLSYQRYYWLFLALAGAAIRILGQVCNQEISNQGFKHA